MTRRTSYPVCRILQAEYSFFFDTGGRRRAYIAPERFYTSGQGQGGAAGGAADARPPSALTPEMVGGGAWGDATLRL